MTAFTSFLLFALGTLGLCLWARHMIVVLLALELLLLASSINFVLASVFFGELLGQIYGLVVLSVAAAESSLGLALLVVYYRLRGGIATDLAVLLKS